MRFEVLTTVSTDVIMFLDVTLCSLVDTNLSTVLHVTQHHIVVDSNLNFGINVVVVVVAVAAAAVAAAAVIIIIIIICCCCHLLLILYP